MKSSSGLCFENELEYVNKSASCLSFCLSITIAVFSPPSADEIAFLEGMTIVYKTSIDLFFYVVGSAQENEVRSIKLNQMKFKKVISSFY